MSITLALAGGLYSCTNLDEFFEIRAVHFRADEPYKLTSGLASPVYIDCRKIISYPRARGAVIDFAGDQPQFDDITLMALKTKDAEQA